MTELADGTRDLWTLAAIGAREPHWRDHVFRFPTPASADLVLHASLNAPKSQIERLRWIILLSLSGK
jgi:hypothetical protein